MNIANRFYNETLYRLAWIASDFYEYNDVKQTVGCTKGWTMRSGLIVEERLKCIWYQYPFLCPTIPKVPTSVVKQPETKAVTEVLIHKTPQPPKIPFVDPQTPVYVNGSEVILLYYNCCINYNCCNLKKKNSWTGLDQNRLTKMGQRAR